MSVAAARFFRPRLARFLAAGIVAPAASVLAAEPARHALSYDLATPGAPYTKRYRIEVGDVPSQVLEVYGRNRNFDREPPAFDDVRVRECRERGVFDLVDESGSESSYVVFLLEDGNRVLARYHGTVSTHRWPDGSRHYDLRGTLQLSGGSGRFGKIRGQLRIWQVLAPGG